MKLSASVELLWQLAGQESVAAQFKEVEPEHFLAALLKFSELPVEELDKMAPGAEAAKVLATEVRAVRAALEERGVDTTRVRRELRARMGRGQTPYEGGQVHRSDASRAIFDAASKLADDAREETVTALHLLEAILAAPTPAMREVLGELKAPASGQSAAPIMAELGRDLVRLAAEGSLRADKGRQAECKALLGHLAATERKAVLLLTESDEAARQVVEAAACAIAARESPAALKQKRIIDASTLKPVGQGGDQNVDKLSGLLAEAARVPEAILYVPAVESAGTGGAGARWVESVKSMGAAAQVQLICRVEPAAFDDLKKGDSAWKRLGYVMWIGAAAPKDLPMEL